MGNSSSTSTETRPNPSFENQEKSREERRRKLAKQKYRKTRQSAWELMSPDMYPFNENATSMSLPSFLEAIESNTPSTLIMNHNMTPGFTASTKTGSNSTFSTTIPASISNKDLGGNQGVARVSKKFQGGKFNVCADTSGSFAGSLYVQPNAATKIGGMVDTNGTSLISGETQTDFCNDSDHPHILRLGSHVEFQSPSKFEILSDSKMTNVGGHAAVYLPNSIMAVEASAPVDTLKPDLSYHLSVDVGEATGSKGENPLIMSMHKSNAKTSFSVTNLNKELFWTLQLEKEANSSKSDIKAGLFYPFNKYFGTQIVATPSRLDGAIVLRNPDLPASCSLLFGTDGNKTSVTGIALELGS